MLGIAGCSEWWRRVVCPLDSRVWQLHVLGRLSVLLANIENCYTGQFAPHLNRKILISPPPGPNIQLMHIYCLNFAATTQLTVNTKGNLMAKMASFYLKIFC